MAVYVQPYNPWKEQAALSLLGGFIDKWQQSEQNRKTNAFRGQLQQDIANLTGGDNSISLMPQSEPQGYNSNPWANAFHKTDSPLTQFNIGTAQSQRRLPTMDEIARAGAALGASKRFSGLNPDTVQKMIGEAIQQNAMSAFSNAGSWDDRINALIPGMTSGGIPTDTFRYLADYAKWRQQPYTFGESDIGTHKITEARNPNDGTSTPVLISPVGLSPFQKASIEAQKYIADLTNTTANRRIDVDVDNSNWERNNPTLTVHTDETGTVYGINPYTGQATPVTDATGRQVTGSNTNKQVAGEYIKSLGKQEEKLIEALADAEKRHSWAMDEEEHNTTQQEIDRIKKDLEEVRRTKNEFMQYVMPQRPQTATLAQPTSNDVTPATPQNTGQTLSKDIQTIATRARNVHANTDVMAQPTNTSDALPDITTGVDAFGDAIIRRDMQNRQQHPSTLSDDISAVKQATQSQPAQQQQPQNNGTVRVKKSAFYDPSRDGNVNALTIDELYHAYTHPRVKSEDLNVPSTFQEFIDNYIQDGGKIKR